MEIAKLSANMSYALKLRVGAIIVKEGRIISTSWNGTPSGWDNECELRDWMPEGCLNHTYYNLIEYSDYGNEAVVGRYRLQTKPEVIHAESNALIKVAKSGESTINATMFCTHSPCMECAKLIYQSGIQTFYYQEEFSKPAGLQFLIKSGIEVHKINPFKPWTKR